MSEKKPFEPLKGSMVVGGKIRTVYVNLPKISFKKNGADQVTTYSAEDVLADQDIVDALVASKSSVIKVIYDPADQDAPAKQLPADDAKAKLTEENAQLKADNAKLTEENKDQAAHISLLEEEIKSLKAPVSK